MEYTIITEENYKEILKELTELTKNKIYTYEYGSYSNCTIEDVIQNKDNAKYELIKPSIYIQSNGMIYNGRSCLEIKANAAIVDLNEHWLYQDYLKSKEKSDFKYSIWFEEKPLIRLSYNSDTIAIISVGSAVKLTDTGFVILENADAYRDYITAYEFKYELTISDEEYLGIKATRELYIEEVNECYNDEY